MNIDVKYDVSFEERCTPEENVRRGKILLI